MKTQHIARGVVAVASVVFAGTALAIWVAPKEAAHALGLEFVRPAGAAVMRADVGGLFAGLAVLCAMAARTARRSWSLAAAAVLASIVIGRVLGWFGAGRIGRDVVELLVEIGCITALLAVAKSAAPQAVAVPRQRAWASSALVPAVARLGGARRRRDHLGSDRRAHDARARQRGR